MYTHLDDVVPDRGAPKVHVEVCVAVLHSHQTILLHPRPHQGTACTYIHTYVHVRTYVYVHVHSDTIHVHVYMYMYCMIRNLYVQVFLFHIQPRFSPSTFIFVDEKKISFKIPNQIQWNPLYCGHHLTKMSSLEIEATSLFQRLICTQKYTIGTSETVLIREMSFQRLICTQKSILLGPQKLS